MSYSFKPSVFEKLKLSRQHSPKPRSGHRSVCNDTFMYSFGGFNPNPSISDDDPQMLLDEIWYQSKPLFKEIWKFNITTREWSLMQNQAKLPNELASVAVIMRGNMLIMHGGSGCPFGEHNSNQTYLCNVANGSFHELTTTGEKPEPQYGQAVVCHGKYFYTIGGTNGYEYTCDVHRLDLTTHVWEAVYICSGKEPGEPTGRYRHEIAFDGRRIFVLGGGTAEDAFSLNELPTFDVVSNKWSNSMTTADRRGYPPPRRCHGLVQYKDELTGTLFVVISGGYNERRVLNDVWRLNLETLQWTCLPQKIPHPVYFHSTTITSSGCMLTFGGITKSHNHNTDEQISERTNAVHASWLTIPRLTEICWLALNFYVPGMKSWPEPMLLKSGIPLKFINRLKGLVDAD